VTTALTHRYTPRGTARDLFACRDPEVLVSGPAGTGKSRGCLEKLHMMALLNPGLRGLIVRKTLASLGSTALVTWRTHVVAEALATGIVAFYGGSPQEAPAYRYTNGSAITVGGMDRSTRIMSSDYDIVYVQEATELIEGDWEAITTRLRNGKVSFQQLLADCNPDAPHHWLKVRCDADKTLMLDSRHEDNPLLFDDTGTLTEIGTAYIGKLDNLTGVRYQRLRRGLWVAAEGLIYEEWDPAIHLVDRFIVPDTWTRYWSVDFGFTNPFVLQCWAEDPDGRLYLYRELYRTKRLVEDHARDILKLVRDVKQIWREPRPRAIICDHDAEDRATLERHLGMSTVPAQKTVSDGIQAVATRLRIDGTGRPRIGVFRDAVVARDHELVDQRKPACTAEEIVGYVWDTGAGKKIKETPLKENDHGCDALRYMVAHLDLGARPRVRFL
jgi:PBSX family phage terminase large subunit